MTVDPPLKDELFGESDEQLARIYDVGRTELVYSAMRTYGISLNKAQQRVDQDETKVRADCYRFNS